MKRAAAMVTQALDQYDAKVIPESHPAVTELSQRFGDHTFFIDGSGLNIIEPVVVNLASYNDDRSELKLHAQTDGHHRRTRSTNAAGSRRRLNMHRATRRPAVSTARM